MEVIRTLIKINPSEGARAWLNRQDVTATFRGEVLAISYCQTVVPSKIYWDNEYQGQCYNNTPVTLGSQLYFIERGSNDLIMNSKVIPCSARVRPIFKSNNSWFSTLGREEVLSIPNTMPFNYKQSSIVLKAESAYKLESSSVFDSFALLSTFSNRINSRNDILDESNINVNDTNFFEELAELDLVEALSNISISSPTWLTNALDKLSNIFDDWATIVTLLVIVISLVIAIGFFIYFFSTIKSILCCNKKGKYVVNKIETINNVSTIVTPSAPEIEMQILTHVPKSYFAKGLKSSYFPIIEIKLGDKVWRALLDTGSTISYCGRQVPRQTSQQATHNARKVDAIWATLANGSRLEFVGAFNCKITVPDNEKEMQAESLYFEMHITKIVELDPDFDIVLGSDFFTKMYSQGSEFAINWQSGDIIINKIKCEKVKGCKGNCNRIMITDGIKDNSCLPKIRIKVNKRELVALVDTGSSITYCRDSVAKSVHRGFFSQEKVNGQTANGSTVIFFGSFHGFFEIGNTNFWGKIFVSQDKDCPVDIIIGTDLLRLINENGVNLKFDFYNKVIDVDNIKAPFINTIKIDPEYFDQGNLSQEPKKLCAAEDYEIDPHSDNVIRAGLVNHEEDGSRGNITIIAGVNLPEMILVGKSLSDPKKGIFVRISNFGNSKWKIYKNQIIALGEMVPNKEFPKVFFVNETAINKEYRGDEINFVPPEADIAANLPNFPSTENMMEKLDLNESLLSDDGKNELKSIIAKNREAFVGSDGNIGNYKGMYKHKIELIDPNKITQKRPYRVPPALRDEVEKQINEMLRQKIIQPSTSPFCSPIVLVKKRDNKWRFAVDYRDLNANTRKATYHLPLIQDIIDLVGGKELFSSFDFQAGFHQLPMLPEHVERTAFATFCGFFEFLRMPFGVCGGPASFQKVMEQLRKELSASFFVYIDDVILASQSENEHIKDIEGFFKVLIKYGLKLKMEKCTFARGEIKYLGYLIGRSGVRPDPKNVAIVQKFGVPKNITELRSLIGALSYFRRFIRNFAAIMTPLYELTRKEGYEVKNWNEQHQQALNNIVKKLATAPVLASPNFSKGFIIETDASKLAVGACLLQIGHDNLEHPIAFSSRKLNKYEAKYPSVELEALGLVFAIKEFRPYIEGKNETEVRTDNSALCSLFKRKDLTGRLAKYQLVIQEFNIKITYRRGKTNQFCDYLSRYLVINNVEIKKNITLEDIIREQKHVKFAQNLFEALAYNRFPRNPESETEVRKEIENFTIFNGALYLKDPLRLFVPYVLRSKLIVNMHECPMTGGHLGIRKSLTKITSRFWWDGMNGDIKKVIKSCVMCQQRKANAPQLGREPLYPIAPPPCPFHRIHTDIVGPLPISNANNKYMLTTIDAFSKWGIAIPIPDQTAITITAKFLNEVLTKFGIPKIVVTDNGKQFLSKIFTDLARIYKFEHRTITPYHPQGNGAIERLHRTLANMIAMYVDEKGSDWDEWLSLLMFTYNTSIQATTNQSPYFVMFGREARLPCDMSLKLAANDLELVGDMSVYLQVQVKNLKQTWEIVRKNIEKEQQSQKLYADRKAKELPLVEQELVLLYKDVVKGGHKFSKHWVGPLRIIRLKRPNVLLKTVDGKDKLIKTHINKIKRFFGPVTLPLRRRDDPRPHVRDKNLESSEDESLSPMESDGEQADERPIVLDEHLEDSE